MSVCKYGFDNGKYGLRFVLVCKYGFIKGKYGLESNLLYRYVNTGLFGKYSL